MPRGTPSSTRSNAKTAGGDQVEAIVWALIWAYVEGEEGRRRLTVRLIQQHRLEPSAMTRRINEDTSIRSQPALLDAAVCTS